MRNPRVVVFHHVAQTCQDITAFFHSKGYETFVLTKAIVCPIYIRGEQEQKKCLSVPCSDIMIVAQDSAQTMGVDLFTRQLQRGCKLAPRNRAIITQPLVGVTPNNLTGQGVAIFKNPLDFSLFETWVQDCESRMDLSQRLAVKRREKREANSKRVHFRFHDEDTDTSAYAVDTSNCGICLRTSSPLKRGQLLRFASWRVSDAEEGMVRWVKTIDERQHLAGVTFCL